MADQEPDPAPRPDDRAQQTYSAEQVRQGEIILRTRTRKIIFFGGLVAFVLLALLMSLAR